MNWRNWLPFFAPKNTHKPIRTQGGRAQKKLRLETLEQRRLLSISVAELDALNTLYSDLKLESVENWNLLEMDVATITAESLQNAVQEAKSSVQDDLIIIRTSDTTRTIQLSETLNISLDSAVSGQLSIVTLGASPLRLMGEMPTLVEIDSGILQFGGITFVGLHTPADNAKNTVPEGFSTSLISISSNAEVTYDSTLFVTSSASNSNSTTTSRLSGSYYSAEFRISGTTTQWAYLTGLTADDLTTLENTLTSSDANRQKFTGNFIDAEKEWSNYEDDELCWAASLCNMLWYTDWGNAALATDADGTPLFQNEDDLFDYFCDSFTDFGGHPYYGMEWFLTGDYQVQGDSIWSQNKNPENGAFYDGDYAFNTDIMYIRSASTNEGMQEMSNALRNGSAISLALNWYTSTTETERQGGHAVTAWGYVYDTAYRTTDTSYYAGIFITDSDDTQGTDARQSLNNLYYNPMTWDNNKKSWYFTNYSSYLGYLYSFTILNPYTSQVSLSTDSTSASLSTPTIHAGDSLTLSNVAVSVGNKEQSHVFTVSVYASLDDTISADTDILLGTMTVDSLSKNTQTTLTFTDLDTTQLMPNTNYHIGWTLNSLLDTNLTDNTATLTSTTLSVLPTTIEGISLTPQTFTYDGASHLPLVTGTQEGDQILYSLDGIHYDSTLNCTDVGTHTIWVSISRDGYQNWYDSTTITISPKMVTITATADDKTYDGNTSATGSATLNGIIGNDSVTLTAGNWNFSDKNAGTHTVTYTDYTLTGADAKNYTLSATSATTSATITPATLNVTINADNKTYDGNTSATGSATLNGIIGDDSVTLTAGNWNFSDKNAGTHTVTYTDYTLTGADAKNYTLSATSATTSATITPAILDTPEISANGTSIFSVEMNLSAVENAFSYHIIVSRDAEKTQIVTEKFLETAEAITFSELAEETEYFISVTALGTGNYANSTSTQISATTWKRQFNLEIQNAGTITNDCMMSSDTLTISGIEITNTGRDIGRKYDVLFYAVPVENTEAEAVFLGSISREGLESGAVDTISEQVLELSPLASGQYTLYWTISATGTETDITDNSAQLSSTLNILTNATLQITDVTKTLENPKAETENKTEITEWSTFKLNVNPEWKSEQETEVGLIRIAYNSQLFTLVEEEIQTALGMEATMTEYSNNPETGMREILISVKKSPEMVSRTQNPLPAVQLSFIPTTKSTLTAGSSANDWLFCNGISQPITVNSFSYDLNEDGTVTILDLVEFARHFNNQATDSAMAYACDFNHDGVVTILDLVDFARKYDMKMDDK